MLIAISSTGSGLDSEVDPRFGRCDFLLLVDTGDMTFTVVENGNAARSGGAGIQVAKVAAQKGVKAVLTGHCGPNAHEALTAAGIDVFTDCSGTVREAVERFKAGGYQKSLVPDAAGQSGMGRGRR